MKKETMKNIKDLGYYSSLGLSFALSIFIGLFVGLWLDKKFETSPILTGIFLLLGIVAGFRNIIIAAKKSKNI